MENFFKCPKSQYICIFTSPINTILTTQFILSRQSDSRDSVVIGTVWVWDRAKFWDPLDQKHAFQQMQCLATVVLMPKSAV